MFNQNRFFKTIEEKSTSMSTSSFC